MELKAMNQSGQVATEIKKADFKQVQSNKITEITSKDKGYKEEDIAKEIDKLKDVEK